MRVVVKNILGFAGIWIPLKGVRGLTGYRDIFPFYHAVSDDDMPHVKYMYRVKTVKQFTRDLDYCLSKFEAINTSDWYESLLGRKKSGKPAMVLSFDDGLREMHDVVAPLLIRKGVPATFFINPAFIDNNQLFYKYKASLIIDRLEKHGYPVSLLEVIASRIGESYGSRHTLRKALLNATRQDTGFLETMAELVEVDFNAFLKIRKPYMSLDQLLKMKDQGFEIGSHSMTHPMFSLLSHEDRLREVKESLEWIRKKLNPEYRYFAFPFTDAGVENLFFDRIYNLESSMVDMSFGSAGLKRDPYPFHVQRIAMDETHYSARIFIKGEYIYYLLKGMAGRRTIRRKG